MKIPIALALLVALSVATAAMTVLSPAKRTFRSVPETPLFTIRSVDTMKRSRDAARESADDASFVASVDRIVSDIQSTGATHVAVGTPYDDEFLPVLSVWVAAARTHGLGVWFRGNLSGWEGWFGYPRIGREEHISGIIRFVSEHPGLFSDGDIFSACPECENGGPGDPRATGDVDGFRRFHIDERAALDDAFRRIGADVRTDIISMNGDVARLVMDQDTTRSLGGTVTIDHYVASPEAFLADVSEIAARSGGRVVIGEFGAPIDGIHERFSEEDQARWIGDVLSGLAASDVVSGVNYWTSTQGSTAIWRLDGSETAAVSVLRSFFLPKYVSGTVQDVLDQPIREARVASGGIETTTDDEGSFVIRMPRDGASLVSVSAPGHIDETVLVYPGSGETDVVLKWEREPTAVSLLRGLKALMNRFFEPHPSSIDGNV